MKRPLLHRQRGIAFTLVELLVVIGIIAILAAIVIGGVSSAIRFAKRTKANTEATSIQTAVQAYYAEYGVYPTASTMGAGDAYYNGGTASGAGGDMADWKSMMIALCGGYNPLTPSTIVTGNPIPNTRQISYLSPTRSDLDTSGVIVNPFGSSATSQYFFMAVDTDYSGVVGDSGTAQGQLPDFTQFPTNYTGVKLPNGTPGGVAVWCPCDQPQGGGTATKPAPANFWAHTY
jgi:prepilin-type N-terminal cleavage/methylation domain-containing protein